MTRSRLTRWLRLGVSVLATAGLLSGCGPGGVTTQSQRIGYDNGTDSCRPQLVALDSTGNFFGEDILKGAAVGALGGALIGGLVSGNWRGALIGGGAGAAAGATAGYWTALQQQSHDQAAITTQINSDLNRENAQIDRTQIAFDQLADCRYRQAQAIRTAYARGAMTRAEAESQMAVVRSRSQRDIALAKAIDKQINARGQQFDVAANNVAPGTTATIRAASPERQTYTRTSAPLKLTPNQDAPDIAELQPRQAVTVGTSRNGYALVQTASGERGYAPVSALQSAPVASSADSGGDSGGDVRTLAGSNAARRDSFAQSIAVTEQVSDSGFQLAS